MFCAGERCCTCIMQPYSIDGIRVQVFSSMPCCIPPVASMMSWPGRPCGCIARQSKAASWMLQATFSAPRKQMAIPDAADMESSHGMPSRLVTLLAPVCTA